MLRLLFVLALAHGYTVVWVDVTHNLSAIPCPFSYEEESYPIASECGSGVYSLDRATACSACGVGSFNNLTAQSICEACFPGSYEPSLGRSECDKCAVGSHTPSAGTTACEPCPVGYFSAWVGQSSCEGCPVGTFSERGNSSECALCADGAYASPYSSVCTLCPPGSYGVGRLGHAIDCTSCGMGLYAVESGRTSVGACVMCPNGTMSSEARGWDPSVCEDCGAGLFSLAPASACATCPAGTASPWTRAPACDDCFEGNFSSSPGSSACQGCSPGSYSAARATACVGCAAGSFSASGPCAWCEAGFSSTGNATNCTMCGEDEYSPARADRCEACPAMSDSPPGSSLSDCVCRAGTRYDPTSGCALCGPGRYNPWTAAEACLECPAGTMSNLTMANASTDCLVCPEGGYSLQASDHCLSCGGGRFSPSGASACGACLAGTFSLEGFSACEACAAGRYSALDLSTACDECAAGTHSPVNGSTYCLNCLAGEFARAASPLCQACPEDTYSFQQAGGCIACPDHANSSLNSTVGGCLCEGGYSPFFRSRGLGGAESILGNARRHAFASDGYLLLFFDTSVSVFCTLGLYAYDAFWPKGTHLLQTFLGCPEITVSYAIDGEFLDDTQVYFVCTPCLTGAYSLTGNATCTPCTSGYYQNESIATFCYHCDVGHASVTPGSTECPACPAGTFGAENRSLCPACPKGHYSGEAASTECLLCDPSTWANAGSPGCSPCPYHSFNDGAPGDIRSCMCVPGYHRSETPVFTCEACQAGYFSGLNQDECDPCPPGSSSEASATECLPCDAGTYQPAFGLLCLPCLAGTHSTQNATDCLPCPKQFYCEGAGELALCPLGSYSNLTGLMERSQCPACPAGQYCPAPNLSLACPDHTSSAPKSSTKLQCSCLPGYVCTYSKTLHVKVTMPLTLAQFEALREQFIEAVAAASGVDPSKVTIAHVTPIPGGVRRLLLAGVEVHAAVTEGLHLRLLHKHLRIRGFPSGMRVRVHRAVRLSAGKSKPPTKY